MKTAVIIEDQPIVSIVLDSILKKMGFDYVLKSIGFSQVRNFVGHADLIIVDYYLPESNGIEIIKKIRAIRNDVHIVFYTGCIEKSILSAAAQFDRLTSISKQLPVSSLIVELKRITSKVNVASAMNSSLGRQDGIESLSSREKEIALSLAMGKSYKEIAHEFDIGSSTVGTYRTRIFSKLGIVTRVELQEYFHS